MIYKISENRLVKLAEAFLESLVIEWNICKITIDFDEQYDGLIMVVYIPLRYTESHKEWIKMDIHHNWVKTFKMKIKCSIQVYYGDC